MSSSLADTVIGIANNDTGDTPLDRFDILEEEIQPYQWSQSVKSDPSGQSTQEWAPQSHYEPSKKASIILLLSASGSGKTLFFNRASAQDESVQEDMPLETTSSISIKSVTIRSCKFILIDTPGFVNPAITDLESFTKLADHLVKNTQDGITGAVYIHRAGDSLKSKALIRGMRVLSEVLLGKPALSRLTILVVPDGSGNIVHASMEQVIPHSTAFNIACRHGARVIISTLEKKKMDRILAVYASMPPILLQVQRRYLEIPQAEFRHQIEECLGYCKKSVSGDQSHMAEAELKERDSKIELLETFLRKKDLHISHISAAHTQTRRKLASSLETTLKFQRTQDEYASLRSQLQLQENIEQSQLVQALKDLNRDIDSIGRSIAKYLVENYVQSVFGKEATEITALNAVNLPALMELFSYAKGRSSLIASSSGVGMPVEDFLDYAIRYLICRHLHVTIFAPFHPGVDPAKNDFIGRMYDDVREQEAQAAAGKWRAGIFKSIYKPENDEATTHRIETIALEIVQDSLDVLIEYFFGQEAGIQLDNQYLNRLTQLVQTAWEWNAALKGEVILLGDFIITFYPPTSTYDPTQMSEFEPRLRSRTPKSILGTLALGLTCSRSLGHGQAPETTVVYKAMVATRNLYK